MSDVQFSTPGMLQPGSCFMMATSLQFIYFCMFSFFARLQTSYERHIWSGSSELWIYCVPLQPVCGKFPTIVKAKFCNSLRYLSVRD